LFTDTDFSHEVHLDLFLNILFCSFLFTFFSYQQLLIFLKLFLLYQPILFTRVKLLKSIFNFTKTLFSWVSILLEVTVLSILPCTVLFLVFSNNKYCYNSLLYFFNFLFLARHSYILLSKSFFVFKQSWVIDESISYSSSTY